MTTIVWQKVSSWCNISPICTYEIRDLLRIHKSLRATELKRKLVQGIRLWLHHAG
ncbi:hypothetical protein HanIR_Chr01g0028611 [Helianthus annuus]|nr:hypothetical protein HanIR_Chr01g0028611 [Helianthus annuus]